MSDIFNEYAKIAIDKGLIVEAQEEKKTNSRYDSLDLEAIEMLYGVKPNGENEKHIVEQAHPEPVIVSPAYDRVNGLVENLLERQDIMHYIATKPNHGKHIQERYVKAKQNLVDEMLKVAFKLDKDNQEDLMNLADDCAERLVKNALLGLAWLTWPLVAKLGGAALAATGLINNFGGMIDKGVYQNSERAKEELNELHDNLPNLSPKINEITDDINIVQDLNKELTDLNISISETGSEEQIKHGKDLLIKYIRACRALTGKTRRFISMLSSLNHGTESSWLTEYGGDVGSFVEEYVVRPITGSDAGHVITILETLDKSLTESIANMQKLYSTVIDSIKNQDQESLSTLIEGKFENAEVTGGPWKQEELPEDLPEATSTQ